MNNIIPINDSRRSGGGYRLPFGMYRGRKVSNVPTGYLRWLVAQQWLSAYCRAEIIDELGKRGALYDEMVMQIIALKEEIDRLHKRLEEAEQRHRNAEADDEFVRALKRSVDSA